MYFCSPSVYDYVEVCPGPVEQEATVSYGIIPGAIGQGIPLTIDLYDQFGNHIQNLKNSLPQLTEELYFNFINLLPGIYHVVFQIDQHIESLPLIKQ